MKTKHRKASEHKRRYTADPMAMYWVMGRNELFTVAEQANLNLPVRLAYDAMINGQATEPDFHTLAAAVNVAIVCAESIDSLVEQTCIAGRDAMMRVHDRQIKLGRWGFDGPGRLEVESCVDVYEQLTSLLTGGQLKQAMSECIRRMQAGKVLTHTESTP